MTRLRLRRAAIIITIIIIQSIMWVKSERENLVRLNSPKIDEPVEFTDNGTAQVPEDVGEQLIKHFDTIHEYER